MVFKDFLITFVSEEDALKAQNILSGLKISGRLEPLFGEIENRFNELFVTLTYPDEIVSTDTVENGLVSLDILQEVTFVAIKNGMHQSKGFAFFTSTVAKLCPENGAHVKELYWTVLDYFNAGKSLSSDVVNS